MDKEVVVTPEVIRSGVEYELGPVLQYQLTAARRVTLVEPTDRIFLEFLENEPELDIEKTDDRKAKSQKWRNYFTQLERCAALATGLDGSFPAAEAYKLVVERIVQDFTFWAAGFRTAPPRSSGSVGIVPAGEAQPDGPRPG